MRYMFLFLFRNHILQFLKKIASVKGHPDFTEAVELLYRAIESSDSGSRLENLFSRYESIHGLNHNHTYSGYLPSIEDQADN